MDFRLALIVVLSILTDSHTVECNIKHEFVREGEMMVLECQLRLVSIDAFLTWSIHTGQGLKNFTNNQSSLEEGILSGPVLIYGTSLIILSVSVGDQGNYSCFVGDSRKSFELTVYTDQTCHGQDCTNLTSYYTNQCYESKACNMMCPSNPHINHLPRPQITWKKVTGQVSPDFQGHFPNVEKKDEGFYICAYTYQYSGQIYNLTRTTQLTILDSVGEGIHPTILKPRNGSVVEVDVGSSVQIDCKAVSADEYDNLYWLAVKNDSRNIIQRNNALPIYQSIGDLYCTLHIREVSEADLSTTFVCALQSTEMSSEVKVTLARKVYPVSLYLVFGIMGFLSMVVVVTAVVCVNLRIDIVLFWRDSLGCHGNTSDEKIYDAYLMYYKSTTQGGLSEKERSTLEEVLEEKFGYILCLYDRDVLPGEAVAEVVLGRIEQSRRLILIPSSSDADPGTGLLSGLHAALVERQTSLVLIQTEEPPLKTTPLVDTDPLETPPEGLPEALRVLAQAGHTVTWRSSNSLSSSFWKQLRYHLPARQHHQRMKTFYTLM